jgi:hypothetical protein
MCKLANRTADASPSVQQGVCPMAKNRSSRWRRLRDSNAIDPGHLAAGSAVIDTFGLLAFEEEQLAVRRQSERRGEPGAGESASVQSRLGTNPASGVGDIE